MQRNTDAFSGYHPAVNFIFFVLVIGFSMVFMHPACLAISLLCSVGWSSYLKRGGRHGVGGAYLLVMMLAAAVMNPLFNHQGATILTYLRNGSPITLESTAYGVAAGVMLCSVISWFSCYNKVMTSDKFTYLFGRVIPGLSLILSMTLRFVPRFTAQAKVVYNARRGLGTAEGSGLVQKVRGGLTVLSVMLTWALENAIVTADSMKSRGYGLKGRTAFSIYRFDRRDALALGFLLFCGAYIVSGAVMGGLYWQYFPTIEGAAAGAYPASLFVCYFALCSAPMVMDIVEDLKWKRI